MRHLPMAVVIVALGMGMPGQAADTQELNYVHAVDWSGKKLVIVKVGEDKIASRITLADQPYLPFGVSFGNSSESNCGGVSFVTQGPLLRVVDHALGAPRATLNVEQQYAQYGLTSLYLRRLEPNRFSASDGSDLRLIYVVGERTLVDVKQPWLLVFDETVLLADPLVADSALLAAAPLCEDCAGLGLDVAVRESIAYSGEQEAFASVLLQSEPELHQRFFRAVFHEPDQDHAGYWLEVSHHPTIEDDVVFTGSSPLGLGLDYGECDGDQVPFGVLKSSAAVLDLSTGVPSCALDGSPADVVISSPWIRLEQESYHFVTTDDNGNGYLRGFPVGGCPGGGANSIEVPIGTYPQAAAIVLKTSPAPWIYTVSAGAGISGVHLELSSDIETGDQITLLGSVAIDEPGFFTSVDATYCADKAGIVVEPPTTPWEDPCDDPENDDPHCAPKGKDHPVQIEPT